MSGKVNFIASSEKKQREAWVYVLADTLASNTLFQNMKRIQHN